MSEHVKQKLQWMLQNKVWPNGRRYLWTDAHGVCALVSLFHETQDYAYIDQAETVVADVYKVLGRPRGLRIGEADDRDGQYFHYLTKWMYAINQLGKIKPEYHERAVGLAKDIHKAFVIPGRGVHWKMQEDLSGPYPGYGLGGLDHFDGYVQYKLLDPTALSSEINDMHTLVLKDYEQFSCSQDLGLGETLWLSHFFPDEPWAKLTRRRCEKKLSTMWVDVDGDRGYFCRQPGHKNVKFAFTNYGISYGIQAVGIWPDKVTKLNNFFRTYKSNDEYDMEAITHVMDMNSALPGVLIKSG